MTIITCCSISIWLRKSPDHKQLKKRPILNQSEGIWQLVVKAIVVRKSLGQQCLYGFKSRPKHEIINIMTKEQLIDKFARFILENSAGDKYFYPNNVKFRGHKVFSIHYSKLYNDYEIYTEEDINSEKEEMDEYCFYYFKDLFFSEINTLYLDCTRHI